MERRKFLKWSGKALLGLSLMRGWGVAFGQGDGSGNGGAAPPLLLFLAGDVMTGRGVDQVLPHSVDPRLFEPYVKNAQRYVELAEAENGPIPAPVPFDYIWGDALAELAEMTPDARIINLETAVTTSDEHWRGKGIHYRMHPGNVPALTAAGIDTCVLGNNHVMDWGRSGLRETLESLQDAGMATPGAGLDQQEAQAPAVLEAGSRRLLIFSYGTPDAGVPTEWRPHENQPGVNLLPTITAESASRIVSHVERHRQPGDVVVISLHWGGNWGYDVPQPQREFAHRLIDAGAADVIHGHSSHHPKGIEVYQGRPIMYGCGDLLNDYEGIGGREEFRSELVLMYFPELDAAGVLRSFEMTPMRVRRFQLVEADEEETRWLRDRLDRESQKFGARVELNRRGRLALRWDD